MPPPQRHRDTESVYPTSGHGDRDRICVFPFVPDRQKNGLPPERRPWRTTCAGKGRLIHRTMRLCCF